MLVGLVFYCGCVLVFNIKLELEFNDCDYV